MREFTLKSVLLGIILSVVMTMANVYLGLYAGMTVSASIPAAVMSMLILRGFLRKGTILENNIVQTIASSGESLAAGIIFTLPALVIINQWDRFPYWLTFFIATLGGIIGVLFMIPLRRSLIVENKTLGYPEGVACAEVLKSGEKIKEGKLIFYALGYGLIFKILTSFIRIFRGTIEYGIRIARSTFYFGLDISYALVGVGYLVGFNVSMLVFIGGFIGWFIGIPLFSFINKISGNPLDISWTIWRNDIRFIGVSAMIVGGLWSILNMGRTMIEGIKQILSKKGSKEDLPNIYYIPLLVITILSLIFLYFFILKDIKLTIVSSISLFIASFFFVAVSSYIVGLVGSSNNPVSGMVISALIFSSIIILLSGIKGSQGVISSLLIASVVCCATCTAGDISQDLKTGFLVGANPSYQQIGEIIGVIAGAFVIPPVLNLLNSTYTIGTGKEGSLVAPQASLFASLSKGIFLGGNLKWNMIITGFIIGVILIIIDKQLERRKSKFRLYVMPVAVGIYLPFSLSIPILLGGIVQSIKNAREGMLISSGLIAGESIGGIIIAIFIYAGLKGFEFPVWNFITLIIFLIPLFIFVKK
uniref:Oligopeptide transporter, OPT family n=1 Tax=candidate division WOR-3 bacterium TaxID=2052148 RepID=A0A7C4U637_UNCW3